MNPPEYLKDLDTLKTYLRRRTENMNTKNKGVVFADLVRHVFTLSPEYEGYGRLEHNPKFASHDQGVDLIGTNVADSNTKILVQARWALDRVDDIDSILSKFETFSDDSNGREKGQFSLGLFPDEKPKQNVNYLIASLDQLTSIISKYERQNRPTSGFYRKLKQENRIHFIDGNKIHNVLRSEWFKSTQTSMSTTLTSTAGGWLESGNVYIGIVSGAEIRSMYSRFGRSIFFDNIRDYLGNAYQEGKETDTVNDNIIKTVRSEPDKMLSRNNGIVIRATSVNLDSQDTLSLDNMSIVNGCQTTMSIVDSGDAGNYCNVLVKIVIVNSESDHWDITRTANLQNEVSRIELDLAQYLRPQIVMQSAHQNEQAYDNNDVFTFLSSIDRTRVQYENIRAMFIGIFSTAPYNIIKRDRNLIQLELVKEFYADDPRGNNLFRVLLELHNLAQKGKDKTKEVFSETENIDIFSRFLDESKGFISYIAILACSSAANIDITKYNKKDIHGMALAVKELVHSTDLSLTSNHTLLIEYFLSAFSSVTQLIGSKHSDDDASKMRQHMSVTLERANFGNLINQTRGMYNFRNKGK